MIRAEGRIPDRVHTQAKTWMAMLFSAMVCRAWHRGKTARRLIESEEGRRRGEDDDGPMASLGIGALQERKLKGEQGAESIAVAPQSCWSGP